MVRARDLEKEDVEEEGDATHLLRDRLRSENDGSDGVPDRDMRGDVDLLLGVTHRPPHGLVGDGVDVRDVAH